MNIDIVILPRPTRRSDFQTRELVKRSLDSSEAKTVENIIRDKFSILSPRNYNWWEWNPSYHFSSNIWRNLLDPLALADKDYVYSLVRQDGKLISREPVNISGRDKSKQNRAEDYKADFKTISKVRNFVSKYYKEPDSNQGF